MLVMSKANINWRQEIRGSNSIGVAADEDRRPESNRTQRCDLWMNAMPASRSTRNGQVILQERLVLML